MKETIVYIDDEEDSRIIYKGILGDIFGEEYEVIAIEPSGSIKEMMAVLENYQGVVSIIIDEKLQVAQATDYQGSDLVKAIRVVDSKMPLYILTSEVSLLEQPLGSVEFIIDKSNVSIPDNTDQYASLMRRHINSFNDIKTKRATRFDKLLLKSINQGLTELEQKEYEELDIIRVKPVLSSEVSGTSEELDKQNELLKEIEVKLEELGKLN